TPGLASAAAVDYPSRSRPGSCRRSTRVVAPNWHHAAIAFSGARERTCFCAGTLVRRALSVEARPILRPFRILDSQRAAFDRTGLSDWRRAHERRSGGIPESLCCNRGKPRRSCDWYRHCDPPQRLWIDPLGPMVKIVPIMVLTLVALAIFK